MRLAAAATREPTWSPATRASAGKSKTACHPPGFTSTGACCPTCPASTTFRPSAARPGPPAEVDITTQDPVLGIVSVTTVTSVNASVSIPALSAGAMTPITCTATKIDKTKSAHVVLRACRSNGCCCDVDPVVTTIDVGRAGVARRAFSRVPSAERFVSVYNGSPGLAILIVEVNGRRARTAPLRNGSTGVMDIGQFMAGEENRVVLIGVVGRGRAHSSSLRTRAKGNARRRRSPLHLPAG